MIHNHSVVETEFQNQFGDSEYSKEEEMYRKLTIVLLALFGVLPACSQDKPNKPTSIDSLLSVSPEAWKVAQNSVRACVRKNGFTYTVEPLSNLFTSPAYLDIPYSAQEAASRKKTGYGIADHQRSSIEYSTQGSNARYANTLSKVDRERFYAIIHGSPENPVAKCPLAVTTENDSAAISVRVNEALSRFVADPTVQNVNSDWVRCMRKSGFSSAMHMWKVKDEVLSKAVDISVDPSSTSKEVEVAKADVRCLGDQVDRLNEIRRRIESEVLQ